ncbi:Transcription factor prr1 [Zancudomyces culisetae]|uniref:Transcription factor prr1 n=1 Tax=Zancudomyces culisetae TaxID=1213189 RepID=A0A1R1PU15_ZANCU|nr:Transcription factor prr1 [Zancudomyces culisetae]|eukprot:OMH84460.1 Transcription factor prr1 [Zancudomyces culisetae]
MSLQSVDSPNIKIKKQFSIDEMCLLGLATGVPDFVKKLFRILEDDTYHSIVHWNEHGDSFIVKDQSEFSKHVLPQHFKHNNFASFVRQLNKYDFHKVKNTEENKKYGSNIWEFQHHSFKHNRPDLLEKIKRKPPLKSRMEMSVESGTPTGGMMYESELYALTEELQVQVNLLTQSNNQVTTYLNQLSKHYQYMSDEINNLKKNMQTQDQLMAEMFQYVIGQENKGV